jgi:hypothetical protein
MIILACKKAVESTELFIIFENKQRLAVKLNINYHFGAWDHDDPSTAGCDKLSADTVNSVILPEFRCAHASVFSTSLKTELAGSAVCRLVLGLLILT